ncbi:MAG: alpha/beta fold hydrolase [Deltaproteobacteria bacterium]|nr:alpha/beta fold hydrolase [Deltaproteobacteria bacterium]
MHHALLWWYLVVVAYRHEPLTGLSYLEAGPADGSLVLLLHGFPDVAESWREVMERLAERGLRAVAPMMPGYRPSPDPPSYDIDTLSELLFAFGRALQPAPALWVGHDWGAAVTHNAAGHGLPSAAITISVPHPLTFLEYTARHAAQLRRSSYMGFFQLPGLPERALRAGMVRELWSRWSPGLQLSASAMTHVEATVVESLPGPLEYYRAMFRPLGPFVKRAKLLRPTDVPMLYLHGAQDGCIAAEAAAGQERWYRGPFESRIIAGGHFLPNESPVVVADAILEWARAQTPTSGS